MSHSSPRTAHHHRSARGCAQSPSAAKSTNTKRNLSARRSPALAIKMPQADEHADLCLVNTCTVTHEGDSKSRQTIRQLAARNPGTRIIVMGCYASRAPEEVAALPGVAEVMTDKRELPDLLGRFGIVDVPTGISTYANRQRAYVKVQDGCLLHCSFCIIPQVRPHFSSRPVQHILDEVAAAGRQRLPRNDFDRHSPGPLRRRMEPRPPEARLDSPGQSGAANRRTAWRFPQCDYRASKRPKSRAN